ncbi:MAG: aldo/keto reductase [Ruminococcus sp.]|nr:aldo/keto reductase [Ruminococcus sp.]
MLTYELKNDKYSVKLPCLAIGGAGFENNDNDETYFSFLDRYLELGGWCVDTARVYCEWLEGGHGASESVIGRWMASRGNRDKVLLCSKGGHPDMETMDISRLSPDEVRYDLEESLKALQTDYIDIYFLHRDDVNVPVGDIMEMMNTFYNEGKIHFIGVSNWTSKRIEEANRYAKDHSLEPIRVSQISYSLAHASPEDIGDPTVVCMDTKEYNWYNKNNFPVMAYSPQAKGFFAKLAKGDAANNLPEGQFATVANLAKLAKVKKISAETGVAPAVIPLAYLNSQPFFVSSVFAVTKLWQLDEDMSAQDTRYDSKTLAFLENMV